MKLNKNCFIKQYKLRSYLKIFKFIVLSLSNIYQKINLIKKRYITDLINLICIKFSNQLIDNLVKAF